MTRRSIAATCVVGCLAVMGSAHAATKPQIVDQVGDGNGINGQGVIPMPGTVTPVYATSADIDTVLFSTDKPGAAATKLVVKMVLAGPVVTGGASGGATYTVSSTVGGCKITLAYTGDVAGVMQGPVAHVCDAGPTGTADRAVAATILDNKVIWSVPLKAFADKGFKPGAVLSALSANTALNAEGGVGPILDEASGAGTYRVGA